MASHPLEQSIVVTHQKWLLEEVEMYSSEVTDCYREETCIDRFHCGLCIL